MFRKQLARAILNASAERSQHKIECQQMARGAAAGISRCAAIAITRRPAAQHRRKGSCYHARC